MFVVLCLNRCPIFFLFQGGNGLPGPMGDSGDQVSSELSIFQTYAIVLTFSHLMKVLISV